MTTDATLQIRNHFDGLFHSSRRMAKSQAKLRIEGLQLNHLDTGQKIIQLDNEWALVKKEKAAVKRKEYIIYAEDEHALYNIFLAHSIFYQSLEEEAYLRQGALLYEREKYILELLQETHTELPLFTLCDFLDNRQNAVFYELNQQPFGTSDEEYAAMRYWQTAIKVECVDQEAHQLIGWFIEAVSGITEKREAFRAEKDQLEFLFKNAAQIHTSQFVESFKKLRALSAGSMPEDETGWHESFCGFMAGHPMPYALSPRSLQRAFSEIQAGRLSLAPICCWSLIRYQKWLGDLLEGKIDLKPMPQLCYEKLFEQNVEEGRVTGKKFIAEFTEKYPAHKFTGGKYKDILFKEMNKLRVPFNELVYPEYYRFLPEKELLKSRFINHCFLSNDIEYQGVELRKAIVLDEKVRFLENELLGIDRKHIRTFLDFQSLKHHLNDMISIMVPDNDLLGQWKHALTQATNMGEGRQPIPFIEMDLIDSFSGIFLQATTRLQQIFDFQPADVKVIYAVCQIRDLDYLEINAQRDGRSINKCMADLKKIFQSELQYVQDQDKCKPIVVEHRLPEKERQDIKSSNTKILAFNYNNIKDDKLSLVLNALIKLKAISPLTTLPQFRRLFNGLEVTEAMEWWATQGDLMVFIKEMVRTNEPKFTSFKQHWKIAVKCFVKKGGIELFDPNQLRLSKPTSREQKFIEAARKFI